MKTHKYAEIFPAMEGEEFDALVKDIKKRGLRVSISTYRNSIIDGRNREMACAKAGVEPLYTDFTLKLKNDAEVLDFVVSQNVVRRHLTPGQRAVIALALEKEYAKGAAKRKRVGARAHQGQKGRAAEHAAKKLGIGRRIVHSVKRIAKEAPELIPDIRSGRVSAREAERVVRMRRAGASVGRINAEKDKKDRQTKDREVAEFLDAIKAFRGSVQTAVKVAEYGKFSPEAARFTRFKLNEVKRGVESLQFALLEIECPTIIHQMKGS